MHIFDTMKDNTQELSDFFKNVQRGLQLSSLSELNSALMQVLEKKDEKCILKNRVIDVVCSVCECNKRTLLNTAFRGTNKIPAALLMVFLNKEYDFTHRQLAYDVFNLNQNSRASISRVLYSFKTLTPKSKKSHAEFMEKYNRIKNVINGF